MLTEEQLEELATIISDRQEQVNYYVLTKIAQKIKRIGTVAPSDVASLVRMRATGSDVKEINKTIASIAGIQEKQVKRIIQAVALDSYLEAKPFYDYREKSFIAFNKNKPIQRVVAAIVKVTNKTMENLSRAQAFMLRDSVDRKILKPTSVAKTYQKVVDQAVQSVQSGITDYNQAMRSTLEQLINSGIRSVTYDPESGRRYSQRLDTAVRRNILDGIRAVNQGVQDETGKQFGADGVEITVHAYPAEDHAPVQGHQFTKEEFEKMQNGQSSMDVQGRVYKGFPRAIGTLNCRHFTYSIIVGHAKPNYTDEQLQKILEENERGYTDKNGKHYTMYDCTQKMRQYELRIRQLREAVNIAKTAGDDQLSTKYKNMVQSWRSNYIQFCKDCGLKPRLDKTLIVTK